MKLVATFSLLAVFCAANLASAAIIVTAGPQYTAPGGGSCSLSGRADVTGGATWTCSGINTSSTSFTSLYFGIKLNSSTFSESLKNTAAAGSGEMFRSPSLSGANQITYTGTTSVFNNLENTFAYQTISTRAIVQFPASGGTLITDTTTVGLNGQLGNNANNGDVDYLWKIASSGFSVTVTTQIFRNCAGVLDPSGCGSWQESDGFYDAIHTTDGVSELGRTDMGFYYSYCGDGITEDPDDRHSPTGVTCDEGGSNGASGSCCTSTCSARAVNTLCRAQAPGDCDVEERCNGFQGACPADNKSTGVCRSAVGPCGRAENCSGTSNTCPSDTHQPSTTVCRAVAGDCDTAEFCTGTAQTCPSDLKLGTTTTCRNSAGVCDPAEVCTGTSVNCPADVLSPTSTSCRNAAGLCDITEFCDSLNPSCPADDISPAGTTCRIAAGPCDITETCSGVSTACPGDALRASTFNCRSVAGVCDLSENCTGTSTACPTDLFKGTAVSCRPVAANCDLEEFCTGSGAGCPNDAFKSSTVECRGTTGICDPAENCTGTGVSCPSDARYPTNHVCRTAAGVCDIADNCDGVSPDCPPDVVEPNTSECRAQTGVCDIAENCDGLGVDCPSDAVEPNSTVCRGAAGFCDAPDHCDGFNKACTTDAKLTIECREVAGPCDVAENCDGVNNNCPGDSFEPTTTECRAVADDCDSAENCTGTGITCPADTFLSSTTICRAALSTACDVTEYCTGTQAPCPADILANDQEGCSGIDNNPCMHTCLSGTCQDVLQGNCCGNGQPDPGEMCDDGNKSTDVDGCPSGPSDTCTYSTWVRGERKNPVKDKYGCQAEWYVANPNGAVDKYLLPDRDQSCTDGDPTCDMDGAIDGQCVMSATLCLNVADGALTCLASQGVGSVNVSPISPGLANMPVLGPMAVANRQQVVDALDGHLLDPQDSGSGYGTALPISANQANVCTQPMNMTMRAWQMPRDKVYRRLTLRMRSKDTMLPRPHSKVTKLRMLCNPNLS